MEADQIQEIHRLRGLNLSPKEIARSLKMRPAAVNEILRQQATTLEQERVASGELDPLYQCLVNESATTLLNPQNPSSTIKPNGFAQIFLARTHRQQLSVCAYLVDYWCLGVKDSFGPRSMNKVSYQEMVNSTSHRFGEDFIEITLEQTQSIVFGAVDYATKLGIEPHKDFAPSQPYLGIRPAALLLIEFGKDGKPFYVNGPYDNPDKILAKLNQSVGEGNYDYMLGLDR
jgi:hypothetical protein